MKKIVKQLRQPGRFTHQFLKKKQSGQQSQQSQKDSKEVEKEHQGDVNKHKQIQKQKYVRKVINKPNQPSALRLQQINQTFNNLSQKSPSFISQLNINFPLLSAMSQLKQKFTCNCKKRVKFYCLKCNSKCSLLHIPPIQLPLNLHIIHHLSQKINKSSVAPMRFLTNRIQFYPFMSVQSQRQNQNTKQVFEKLPVPNNQTYILYPHKNSKSLKQVQGDIKDLIVLDCTWFQTDQIIQSLEQIGYNNFIKLEGYQSVFWRYNHYGTEALSSAQSTMYFFREYQSKYGKQIKEFDKLMLLYALNMQMVGSSMQKQ